MTNDEAAMLGLTIPTKAEKAAKSLAIFRAKAASGELTYPKPREEYLSTDRFLKANKQRWTTEFQNRYKKPSDSYR